MRLASLLITAALLFAETGALAQEYVPGRVIVGYHSGAGARVQVRMQSSSPSVRRVRALGSDAHLLETEPSAAATEALLAQLRADPEVAYAQPDYIRHHFGGPVMPDDPLFGQQWALPLIHAPQAWSRTIGSEKITVAIVDTGIVAHPELVSRVVPGYDFISNPLDAGDGDGRDPDPTDVGTSNDASSGLHGTHVSGIVAASSNNQVGVAGLDWSCHLLPVRVLGVNGGRGVDSDIADAIRWSAGLHVDGVPDNQNPAQVINMSFGGPGISPQMQQAIDEALAAGVTAVVAAAGNDGVDAKTYSPAGLHGVIAVGAVDNVGAQTTYSNYGSVIALVAPGGGLGTDQGVLSTLEQAGSAKTYFRLTGTSQATPFVSGAIALMKSVFPAMTAGDALAYLQMSANPMGRCTNPTDANLEACGAGLLDVDAAVAMATTAAATQAANSATVVGGCGVGGARGTSTGTAALVVLLGLALFARRAWRA
jgi:serine protease